MSDKNFVPRKRMTGVSKKAPVKEPKLKLWFNEEADKHNKELFDKFFKKEVCKDRYTCVICGRDVSINGSYSNKGNKLICLTCAENNFAVNGKIDIKKLYKWLGE